VHERCKSTVVRSSFTLFPQRPGGDRPSWVTRVGAETVSQWRFVKRLFATLGRALVAGFEPGTAAAVVSRRVTVRQIFFTGFEALPLVSVMAMLVGATIIIQAQLVSPLPGEVLGKVLVAVVLREVAPLTTALVVAGRSGTAMATELGNMKVNDEVLALVSLGINPYRFIVLPRLIGTVVSVLVLTVYFGALAIIGGYLANALIGGPSFSAMRSGFTEALVPLDLPLFVLKGTGLGVIVGWWCCHFGLEVGASPTEVPQRASQAVVFGMLACVVLNTCVTLAFYWIAGPPIR
jgi:phospholipid/cholesterol/gamma-HCH transport system permease protein